MTPEPLEREARYQQTLRDVGRWLGSAPGGGIIDTEPERWAVHVTIYAAGLTATIRNLQAIPRPLLGLYLDLALRELMRRVRDELWQSRWTTTEATRFGEALDRATATFFEAIEAYERSESDDE